MRNGDFIAVGTVDFTDEEMSLIKNIFDSICFYPYKSDNTYKGEKVTTTLMFEQQKDGSLTFFLKEGANVIVANKSISELLSAFKP